MKYSDAGCVTVEGCISAPKARRLYLGTLSYGLKVYKVSAVGLILNALDVVLEHLAPLSSVASEGIIQCCVKDFVFKKR